MACNSVRDGTGATLKFGNKGCGMYVRRVLVFKVGSEVNSSDCLIALRNEVVYHDLGGIDTIHVSGGVCTWSKFGLMFLSNRYIA